MVCLWASYKKKYGEKNIFLHPYYQYRKESDPLVIGTDPGIRIRTKMSRIPNTEKKLILCWHFESHVTDEKSRIRTRIQIVEDYLVRQNTTAQGVI
jgi:hypothetical protein